MAVLLVVSVLVLPVVVVLVLVDVVLDHASVAAVAVCSADAVLVAVVHAAVATKYDSDLI